VWSSVRIAAVQKLMVAQPTHSCQLNLISSTFLLKTGKEVMHIVSIENINASRTKPGGSQNFSLDNFHKK
jgi:hypothetical protein